MKLLDDREFERQSNFETYKKLEISTGKKVEFGNGHILMSSPTSITVSYTHLTLPTTPYV